MSSDYSVILTTTDTPEEARTLARGLVESRLAACVQILPIDSHYEWEGKLEESKELLLLVKTRSDLYGEVEKYLQDKHSYDTPEVLQVGVTGGSAQYLAWLDANTQGGP